jgi:Alanine dehydrogenase/PNT, C-terminal domain
MRSRLDICSRHRIQWLIRRFAGFQRNLDEAAHLRFSDAVHASEQLPGIEAWSFQRGAPCRKTPCPALLRGRRLGGGNARRRAHGIHGAVTARVSVGSTVYVAGAGPVGLAAAASARILGAAAVLIGDMNKERLAHAKKVGFEPIDLTRHDRLGELVADVLGVPEVDSAIDCVGFEAKAQGTDGKVIEAPAVVLNSLMEITRAAGAIGIPGLYVTDDPGAKELAAKHGNLSLRLGLGWANRTRSIPARRRCSNTIANSCRRYSGTDCPSPRS